MRTVEEHIRKTHHNIDRWIYDSSGVVFAICKHFTYPDDEQQCILTSIKEIHDL